MKMLAVSDIHGSDRGVRQIHSWIDELVPDLLVVCGDITHFGPASFARDFLEGLSVKTLAVPGNCDPESLVEVLEELGVNLHKKKYEFKGQTFVGFGGSNPTPFDTLYEMPDNTIHEALRPLMVRDAVLVTHAPPYGTLDGTTFTGPLGSRSIGRLINEFEPKLAIFGHIHEAKGLVKGKVTYLNPGSAREGYGAFVEIGQSVEVSLLG
jgi:putative phosphoesterase